MIRIYAFLIFALVSFFIADAQDCKPDLDNVDKISKQGNKAWQATLYETGIGNSLVNTSDWALSIQFGRYGNENTLLLFLSKSEESAQNQSFESQFQAQKGNSYYLAFSQGEAIKLNVDDAKTVSKMNNTLGKLVTTITIGSRLTDDILKLLNDRFATGNITTIRLMLSGNLNFEKDIKTKKAEIAKEKFNCFNDWNKANPPSKAELPKFETSDDLPENLPRDPSTNKVTFSEVVNIENATKDQLFDRAKNWMVDYYKSDKLSIENKTDGKLGYNASFIKTYAYPGMKAESDEHFYNILLSVKEGKYKFTITDIVMYDGKDKTPLEQGYEMISKSTRLPANYKKYVDQQVFSGIKDIISKLKAAMSSNVIKKDDW